MKFVSKKAHNSNVVARILDSAQQLGGVYLTLFPPRHLVQMATLGYGCS